MKKKMPKTPLSTGLSGSTNEIRLRLRNITQQGKKKTPAILICLTAVMVLLCCGLVSCQAEQPPVESPVPSVPAQTPEPAVQVSEPAEDALTNLIAAVDENSVFYAKDMKFYILPDDLLADTDWPRHYGKSVFYSTSMLYEYLPEQQEELLNILRAIDISTFRQVDKETAFGTGDENWAHEQFVTVIETPSGGFSVKLTLPALEDGPSEVVLCVGDVRSGISAYYRGPHSEDLFGVVREMYKIWRMSTLEDEKTVKIYDPGDQEGRVTPRWVNIMLLNLIDGITMKAPVREGVTPEEEGCTVRVVIGGDEYWINTESGVVVRDGNAHQLDESGHIALTSYLPFGDGRID